MTGKPRIVLAIDDDDISNYLTRTVFESANVPHELVFKPMVEEAIDYLKSPDNDCPDLILLDINLPILSGWDFLDLYRDAGLQRFRPVVIVMLSSSVYKADRDRALAYEEVVDYIEKPLSVEDVRRISRNYLC